MRLRSKLAALAATGTRIFLGLIFFTGGMSKLIPFPGVMGPVWLEEALEPHGLGLYARFIAWSEAVIGLLLLSRRFRTVGAIMLVPMVLNILMVTVSMQWRGTPWVVGFFLLLNLGLVAYDYPRWKFLFATDSAPLVRTPVPGTTRGLEVWHVGAPLLVLAGVPVHGVHPTLGYLTVGCGFLLLVGTGVVDRLRTRRPDSA